MTELRTADEMDYADDSILGGGDSVSPGVKKGVMANLKTYFQTGLALLPSYTGNAGKALIVNLTEDGLEWGDAPGGGGGSGVSFLPIAGAIFDGNGPTVQEEFGGTLTKTGTGRFTFTFDTAQPDDGYFVVGTGGRSLAAEAGGASQININVIDRTTAFVKFNTVYANGLVFDGEEMSLLIFPKSISASPPVPIGTIAGDYTVDGSESYTIFEDATPQIVTLPAASAIGFQFSGHRGGAGTVTFDAGAGAAIVSADALLALRAQYSAFTATKISATEWALAGDLA